MHCQDSLLTLRGIVRFLCLNKCWYLIIYRFCNDNCTSNFVVEQLISRLLIQIRSIVFGFKERLYFLVNLVFLNSISTFHLLNKILRYLARLFLNLSKILFFFEPFRQFTPFTFLTPFRILAIWVWFILWEITRRLDANSLEKLFEPRMLSTTTIFD